MTSTLILLAGFDPGTYVIEDDGDPTNGIAQMRGPDGNVILFNIPTEFLTITASAGRDVVFNLTEWDPLADINVGSLTDPGQNPDSITIRNIDGAADVTLAATGAITELGSDAAADIRANSVVFSAGNGVGTAGNAIETQVLSLEAETVTGGVNLSNIGALTIGGLTDDVAGVDVETSGDIRIVSSGTLQLGDASPGGFEIIHGGTSSGNVTLIAQGASSDITAIVDRDAIAAPGGNVTLMAGRDLAFGTAGLNYDNDVRARGSLTINAGRDLNVDGFADLASDGYGGATGGNVVVNAGRDINVLNATGTDGSIAAEGSAGGDVILNAGPGGFVRLLASSSGVLLSSSGSVVVNADRLVINATAGITANAGGIALRPRTEGWAIDVGSATDGAFALEISDAEADRLFAPNVTIGSLGSGLLTASAGFGPASLQNLELISGTDIRLTSAMTVLGKLTLRAGDNVHLLPGTATTAADLDVLVDQNGNDGNAGGANTFGGAATVGTPTIFGGVDADMLHGSNGNDTLNGGAGNDVLAGGLGDDMFYVDAAGDVVVEAAGQGSDRVFAASSYALGAGVHVEIMSTTNHAGTGAINLTGNELVNSIAGNAGNNVLNGGGGADTLNGLGGDDWFYVDNAADVVVEAAGQGNDRILTSVNYALGAGVHVEVMSTTNNAGLGAINLAGNELANSIAGNNGANVIDGRGGNDTLQGLGGADTFRFSTTLGAGNIDAILGYSVADDSIQIDNAVFAGLANGALAAGAFRVGAAAADADDRIIYNNATGALLFDADGNGAGGAVQFATLSAGLAMTAAEFVVI